MASYYLQTSIEPSIVTVPLFRTDISRPSSLITTTLTPLESITTVTISATVTAATSDATLTSSFHIPSVPADVNAPLADGKVHTPAVAIATLVAVIVCGLILLTALSYFIFLRFRGKCPNCPGYEDELKLWKNGNLKRVTPSMVQGRMRTWDLEKGDMNHQVQMHKAHHLESLARLEGRADSVWSGDTDDEGTADEDEAKEYAQTDTGDARYCNDSEESPADPPLQSGFDHAYHAKTHSAYLREVIAPREAEAKRSLQEAQEQAFARQCDIASNPFNRESVQQRATAKVNEMIVEREARRGQEKMLEPRLGPGSRFQERFSADTKRSFH